MPGWRALMHIGGATRTRMENKTRILIVTDSPVLPSGMAETTRLIFSTLLDCHPDQYELHQVGLFHCYAVTQARWPIYPTQAARGPDGQTRFVPEDKYGQRTFPKCAARVQPDIVFGYGEPQRVAHLCVPHSARKYRLVLYVNFDGLPVPASYCAPLRNADLIFTKSEFSLEVLASVLPDYPRDRLGYVYSPADTERFVPLDAPSRADLRKDLFPPWMPPNAFVLGWVGRNQWRKQSWLPYKVIHHLRSGDYLACESCGRVTVVEWDPIRQQCGRYPRSFSEASRSQEYRGHASELPCSHCGSARARRADPMPEAFLWLHMPEEPDEAWPVQLLEQQFGLKRGRDIHYTEGHGIKAGLAPADMPALYNLWDALLYLSGGEGFGLPAWEAICCALPVIYTDYSSHAEFLGRANAGLPVGGILQPEKETCIWRMIADIGQVLDNVRKLISEPTLGMRLGASGRAFASRFALEAQAERWHKVFQGLLRCEQSSGFGGGLDDRDRRNRVLKELDDSEVC
jgi:glycosyltransferase involved in cell wall biosynthesis